MLADAPGPLSRNRGPQQVATSERIKVLASTQALLTGLPRADGFDERSGSAEKLTPRAYTNGAGISESAVGVTRSGRRPCADTPPFDRRPPRGPARGSASAGRTEIHAPDRPEPRRPTGHDRGARNRAAGRRSGWPTDARRASAPAAARACGRARRKAAQGSWSP
jgi:hypothetical protein